MHGRAGGWWAERPASSRWAPPFSSSGVWGRLLNLSMHQCPYLWMGIMLALTLLDLFWLLNKTVPVKHSAECWAQQILLCYQLTKCDINGWRKRMINGCRCPTSLCANARKVTLPLMCKWTGKPFSLNQCISSLMCSGVLSTWGPWSGTIRFPEDVRGPEWAKAKEPLNRYLFVYSTGPKIPFSSRKSSPAHEVKEQKRVWGRNPS